jgi:hypothetical protein
MFRRYDINKDQPHFIFIIAFSLEKRLLGKSAPFLAIFYLSLLGTFSCDDFSLLLDG